MKDLGTQNIPARAVRQYRRVHSISIETTGFGPQQQTLITYSVQDIDTVGVNVVGTTELGLRTVNAAALTITGAGITALEDALIAHYESTL